MAPSGGGGDHHDLYLVVHLAACWCAGLQKEACGTYCEDWGGYIPRLSSCSYSHRCLSVWFSRSIQSVSLAAVKRVHVGLVSGDIHRSLGSGRIQAKLSCCVLSVGVFSTLLGFAAAYTDYRYEFRGKSIFNFLMMLPPTIPPVIMGLAMLSYLTKVGYFPQSRRDGHSVCYGDHSYSVVANGQLI